MCRPSFSYLIYLTLHKLLYKILFIQKKPFSISNKNSFTEVYKKSLVPSMNILLQRRLHCHFPRSLRSYTRITDYSLHHSDRATMAACSIRWLHLTWMHFQATLMCF